MISDTNTLKTYFETGDYPTQSQFYDFLETTVGLSGSKSEAGSSSISPDKTMIVLTSTSGEVEMSANPQISAGKDHQEITIIGNSNTNYIVFIDGNGLSLRTDKIHMKQDVVLKLMYSSILSKWVETSRTGIYTNAY